MNSEEIELKKNTSETILELGTRQIKVESHHVLEI